MTLAAYNTRRSFLPPSPLAAVLYLDRGRKDILSAASDYTAVSNLLSPLFLFSSIFYSSSSSSSRFGKFETREEAGNKKSRKQEIRKRRRRRRRRREGGSCILINPFKGEAEEEDRGGEGGRETEEAFEDDGDRDSS